MGNGSDTTAAVSPLGTRATWPGDEELALAAQVGLDLGQRQSPTQGNPRNLLLSSATAKQKSGAIKDARFEQQGTIGQQREEAEVPKQDPPGRYRVLAITTTAVVFGLATWFSATAVR